MSLRKTGIMPELTPLYPPLPYHYKGCRRIAVYCTAPEEAVRELLPEPLEYVGNVFEVFVMHSPEVEGLAAYNEGGIIIPAKYNGTVGAHICYEYVENDDSLCAGREIWGYPKKIAQVTWDETADGVVGTMTRRGKEILRLNARFADPDFTPPNMFPRLQVKTMPRADAPGRHHEQVIQVDFAGVVTHVRKPAVADVTFGPSAFDPLHRLGPVTVLGAVYTVGDFVLTYGKDVTTK